ncbi:MAG: HAD-IA family hydrolase [Candidatus Binatota bacterium]|nr:HAD-IA family hydrolase [Candidatus Binatota bacterium]
MPSEIPSNARIKAVFFDAAGTLIKPARRVGESYAAVAAKYGKAVTPTELFERFRICFDGAPPLAFPGAATSEIETLERQWWKRVVAQVFEPWGKFAKFDDFFDELFAYFARADAWLLYPEVIETLAALKQRGLILAVISNFDSRLVRILEGLHVGASFEHIFVSSAVGYAKPQARIFDIALSRFGLTPGQALHIGDSESNDLQGARNAGVPVLLIDRGLTAGAAPPDRIYSLRQILGRLD